MYDKTMTSRCVHAYVELICRFLCIYKSNEVNTYLLGVVVVMTTTYAINSYHHQRLSSNPVLGIIIYDNVCQSLATGRSFSTGTPVSSNNKTDFRDIA